MVASLLSTWHGSFTFAALYWKQPDCQVPLGFWQPQVQMRAKKTGTASTVEMVWPMEVFFFQRSSLGTWDIPNPTNKDSFLVATMKFIANIQVFGARGLENWNLPLIENDGSAKEPFDINKVVFMIWYYLIINFPDRYHRSIDWYPISESLTFSTLHGTRLSARAALEKMSLEELRAECRSPRAVPKKMVWSKCYRGWWTEKKKLAKHLIQ